MPTYYWDADKDALLRRTRGISFDQIVHSIRQGGLLDDVPYPNQQRRPGERMFIVNIGNYAYQVPYYRTENGHPADNRIPHPQLSALKWRQR